MPRRRQSDSSPLCVTPVRTESPSGGPLLRRRRAKPSPTKGPFARLADLKGPFARRTNLNASLLLALGLTALGNTACDSCNRDRPYIPFQVDSAIPAPTTDASVTPTPSAAVPAVAEPLLLTEARHLEPPGGRLELAGRALELPKKMLAEWSLEQDFTGDGQLDALVITRPETLDKDYPGPLAELWFYPTGADAKLLWSLPGWVPSGQGCTLVPHLQGLANGYAWLEVRANCQGSLQQRTPTRLLALFAPSSTRPMVLGLRVAEPSAGESLTISPKVTDRDGDGRFDPALSFEMTVTETNVTAKADLGWLDRAAGASADDNYFSTSLEPSLLAWEAKLGKKAKGSRSRP